MTQIGSIYVAVKGDDTQFKKDMSALRKEAKKSGSEVGNALNNAIKPGTASKGISTISTNLKQLAQTAKVPEKQFRTTANAIAHGLKDVAAQTGMTEKQFAALNEKMLRHQAYKTAENSLRNIARSAGLSGKEIKQMAIQMGYSSKEARKMADSIDRSSRSTGKLSSAMSGFLRTMLPVMSGALVVRGLQRMSSEFLTTADRVAKLSRATGVAVETLSAYRHAADLSGTSFESTAKGIERLARNMLDMSQGIGEAKRAFEMLGVQVVDSSGKMKSSDQVMMEIADRFASMEDGAEKTGLAMQIFGRAGADLIPMLNQGSKGIREMTEEAKQLGITFDAETAAQAERVNDQITRLSGALRGTFYDAMEAILPRLESAADYMVDWVKENKNFLSQDMPDNVAALATSIKDIKSVYDTIPEDVKGGAGVVGALLFGKKIALIVAAIQLVPKLANTVRGFQAAFEGKLDWAEFAAMNAKELEAALKSIESTSHIFVGKIERNKKATEDLGKSTNDTAKNVGGLGTAFKETAEDIDHYNAALEKIKTDQANKEAEQWNGVLAIQRQIREEEQKYQEDKLDEAQKLQDEITKDHESQLRERQRDYDRFIGRVEDKTADIFYDMFRGIGNGWDNLLESMKDIFFRVLSEMAAQALMKPLIVPIVSAAAGILGLPSMAQAATGAVSGGFSMPSFTGMSGLPGMGWLGATLPGTASASMLGGGASAGLAFPGGMGAAPAGFGGVTIGSALGAGALAGLGYSTIGSAMGLPQSPYSGITSGLGGALGSWGGSALTAGATSGWLAGATAGSVVPVVGTIIGAALGGILGGALGGGEEENTFTLTELTQHLDTDLSGSGLFDPTGFRHPSQGNAWYKPIANKYFEIVEGLQNEFNIQVKIASELLGLEDSRFVEELAKFDYTPQAQGRWTVSDAENAIEEITTEYAKYLRESIGYALGKSGYPVIKEIYEEIGGITTELVQVMSVVPDGIERIAEYMQEGATAAEAIEKTQFDYQKVSGVLGTALNAALGASVQSLDFTDFRDAFSQNLLQQVQAAVVQSAQSSLMQSIISSAFDPILDLDQTIAAYFSGEISIHKLTRNIDGMLESITNAVDGGAFDKFAEVIEKLGLAVEDAVLGINRAEILMVREGGRQMINELVAGKAYPSTFLHSIGATGAETHSLLGDIFSDQKVVWEEVEEAWQSLNDQFEQGIIDAGQYSSILSYVLEGYDEVMRAEQDLADARKNNVDSIDQLLNDLTYGEYAGPMSMEKMAGRFGSLYSDAMNLTGADQTAAIQDLVSFAPQYMDFAQAYGGFGELRTDLVTLFEALREDAAGKQDYVIHIEIDGKEIAHVVATQYREGNPELISAVGAN